MASLIGKEIGKYRITERLGQGGMAEVYVGIHTHLDKKVAVKVLHSHLLIGGDFVARFKREAKAVANLQHPNIVQVYDFDIQDDLIFMVMQYIEGSTLHTRLVEAGKKKQRLPIKLIASIINDIASALDYAHSKGMLHRDIKPSNILIDNNDKAYLADFGIAKLYDEKKFTATGQLVGTPAYMSPEQGRGDDLTKESDIYSLGVVAFEMLTGQVPYDAQTPIGIVLKQINDPVPTMSELVEGVPGTAQEVIDRALAKSPEGRYSSAEELVSALRIALQALETLDSVQVSIPEDPPTVVNDGLDAPTVTMQTEDIEQPTVVMEKEVKKEEPVKEKPPKKKPKEMPYSQPTGEKKKFPLWAYIVGGVVLLGILGIILTQLMGLSLPSIGLKTAITPSPTSAIEIYKREIPTIAPTAIITSEDLFQQASDLLWNAGQYQDSIDLCNQAIAAGYEYPEFYTLIGISLLEMEEPEAAFEALDQAIALDPTNGWPYKERGRVKHELGDLEGALDDFEIALELDPENQSTYLNHIGWVYYDLNQIDEALAVFERSLEIDPENFWGYISRGTMKRVKGDLEGALQDYLMALEFEPESPNALHEIGITYYDLGRMDEAYSTFERVLELAPDFLHTRIWRAKIRWEVDNDMNGALEDLDIVNKSEIIPWAFDVRGSIYQDTGQYELCVTNYDEVVATYPDYPWTYNTRGFCYEKLGDFQAARQDYARFLELTAGDPELDNSRYWVQKSLDNLNK